MTARVFENVNNYALLFKMRHLKHVATRHQLQGSIVYWNGQVFFREIDPRWQLGRVSELSWDIFKLT